MAAKKEDYRVTRGKALEAEKKRVAANPNKKVVLPSKENMKNVVGLALTVAGPGKVVKGAQLAAKAVKAGSEGRAVARGLKAANKDVGIKYKKGYNKDNYSGRNETKPKQVAKSKVRRAGNPDAPMTQPSSYKEAKSGYNTWAKKNPEVAKANPPSVNFLPKISRSTKENKIINKTKKK